MLPILNIGPLALQAPGLALLMGLWLGLALAERKFARFNLPANTVYNLVFIGLATAAVGGRLTYAGANFPAFIKSPLSLISPNPYLWDWLGGTLSGLLACAWYAKRQKISLWNLLDALTPALAVEMAALGLAHLASGDAYGETARLPWSIYLWGEWRHPSQVYEILAALMLLLWVMLVLRHRETGSHPPAPAGNLFVQCTALAAVAHIFIGAYRADDLLLPGQVRLVQVTAWVILAACLFLLGMRKKRASAVE